MQLAARIGAWDGGKALPYDAEVEYLTTDGTWPGFVTDINRVDCGDIEFLARGVENGTHVLIGGQPWTGVAGGVWRIVNSSSAIRSYENEIYRCEVKGKDLYIEGGKEAHTNQEFSGHLNIGCFTGSGSFPWIGRIGRITVKNVDNTNVIFRLIPCIYNGGTVGFYNELEGTFITHNSFVAGPQKTSGAFSTEEVVGGVLNA